MPEITQDKAKVSPEVFQAIMLDDIAQGIRRVEKAIRETIPEGIIESYEVTATTSKQEVRPPVLKKWHKVSVLNKGPDTVKIAVNVGRVNAVTIEKNRSYEVDMKSAKIEYVIYQTDSGTAGLIIDTIR